MKRFVPAALLRPAHLCCFPGRFGALGGCQLLSTGFPTLSAQLSGSGLILRVIINLTGRDLSDLYRPADNVGWPLLSAWSFCHSPSSKPVLDRDTQGT